MSAAAKELPIDYRDGLVWISVAIAGESRSYDFLLDSGAEQSVIDLKLAQKLGIRLVGQEMVLRTNGPTRSYLTERMSLGIGEIQWSGQLLGMELGSVSRRVRGNIDGLIGMDFLRGRRITIDYDSETLSFDSSSSAGRKNSAPIRYHGGAPCVALRVGESRDYPRVRIDTGCDEALRLYPLGSVSTGKSDNTKRVALTSSNSLKKRESVQLGATRMEHIRVSHHHRVSFPGEHGLMGNPLLAQFGRVTLDFRVGRIFVGH